MSKGIVSTNRVVDYKDGMVMWKVEGNKVKSANQYFMGDADVWGYVAKNKDKTSVFYLLRPGHDPYDFQKSIGSFNPFGKYPVRVNDFNGEVWTCSCYLVWEGPLLPSDVSPFVTPRNSSKRLKYTF